MITEDYCSYEVAKLLKEKGFDEYCRYFYDCNTPDTGYLSNKRYGEYIHNSKVYDGRNLAACPTHQMAMAWLREMHKIMITIIPQEINVGVDRMCYAIYRITEDLYQPLCNGKVDNLVDSYEETVEAALKYSLENLI